MRMLLNGDMNQKDGKLNFIMVKNWERKQRAVLQKCKRTKMCREEKCYDLAFRIAIRQETKCTDIVSLIRGSKCSRNILINSSQNHCEPEK